MAAPKGAGYRTGTHLSFMRRNTTKKIEIRTTARFASPARRTAAWALCVTFSDTRPEVEPAKEPFPS